MTATNHRPQQTPIKLVPAKGNEKSRLIAARTSLLLGEVYFGLIVCRLRLEEAPWIITAGTDGRKFFYNPEYIAGLTDQEVIGLWGHEAEHITEGHLWRMRSCDPRLRNLAMDYAIDPMLKRWRFTVPNETVNPAWHGKSAEEIYLIMDKERKDQPQSDGGGGGKPGTKQGNGGDPRAPKYMPGKDVLLDPGDAEELKAEWKQAIAAAAQIAKSQGKLPADLEHLIEQTLAPTVDWKSVCRRFAQQHARNDYTWNRPSMRYMPTGFYLPSLKSEQMPPAGIGWDTSGSCYTKQAQEQIGGEVRSIIEEVRPELTHVVYFDSKAQRVQEFLPGDELKFAPKGGGGTDFRPVFEWFEEHGIEPAFLIMVTDCAGTYPEDEPPYPVLWACTMRDAQPPFGEFVYVDLEGEQ